jgi:hypothetical protein
MYILTEEEYTELVNRGAELNARNKKKMQDMATLAANSIPWKNKYYKGVYGCIYNTEEENEKFDTANPDYCDECPCIELCPSNKHWSK